MMTYSFDGGATFIPEFYVSQDSTNFNTVGMRRSFGIGEYNQVVATIGHAIPVWADGRKGNGDLDIYAAIVPIGKNVNGINELQNITKNFGLEIYPNPVFDQLRLKYKLLSTLQVNLYVINQEGKKVMTLTNKQAHKGTMVETFDISELAAGSYKVILQTNAGIEVESFVKVR